MSYKPTASAKTEQEMRGRSNRGRKSKKSGKSYKPSRAADIMQFKMNIKNERPDEMPEIGTSMDLPAY